MDRRTFMKCATTIAVSGYLPNLLKKNMAFASPGNTKTALIVSHLDDDVIFFLPWLDYVDYVIIASLPGTFGHLEVIKNYTERYNAVWQFARGIVSFEEYRDIWLDPVGRHELITEESYDLILRDLIANPEIDEIFTHNPWGEYGHLHHRQVSEAVRNLGVEYGKKVWCPNIVVKNPDGDTRYSALDEFALQERTGYFHDRVFKDIRNIFRNGFINETFPINYWTWNDTYPERWQRYFLAVNNGIDWAENSMEIQELMYNIPVFGK